MSFFRLTYRRIAVLSALYVAAWGTAVFIHFLFDRVGLFESFRHLDPFGEKRVETGAWGLLYALGLGWTVVLIERAALRLESNRLKEPSFDWHAALVNDANLPESGWNPFNPSSKLFSLGSSVIGFASVATIAAASWILFLAFHRDFLNDLATASGLIALMALAAVFSQGRKLRQSLAIFSAYSLLFLLLFFLVHLRLGSDSDYVDELPAGGGSDAIQASSVKIKKIIRKKYVINPYSSILFAAPPPIDQIDPKLNEETANRYQVGQGSGATGEGDGEGSGFGSGTGRGKAVFVRLRHADRGWDRNYGIDGDRNMLLEYHLRTKQKIAEQTEYIEAATAPKRMPPLVYICGIQSLPLSSSEKKSLHDYLFDKHGMILGDNHGGSGFHGSFIAVMNEITGVAPVPVPRDDYIHQKPYALPQLPIVVAHGGTTPLGWKLDGRWAVYYHPGALSDAWRSDHAGIRKAIAEQCYQLGVNLMYYSMRERNKWNQSRKR